MTLDSYDVGDTARLTVTFRDATKQLADPTTVTLTVRAPSRSEATYTLGAGVTRDSLGVFHGDVVLASSGRWVWRWAGTGAVAAADEGSLYVNQTGV